MRIMTLTMNPALDVSIAVDQLVAEKKLRCTSPLYEPGGGGINVAIVIHELGGTASALYAAGGATGQMLRELLEAKGIEQQPVPIEGRTREDITLLEKTSGQLYRLVTPGPKLSDHEKSACLHKLANLGFSPEYMVISGSLPRGVGPDFYIRVIRMMKPHGTRVILDTKAQSLKEVIKEGVFLVKPNMNELRELAGGELAEEAEQERFAAQLVAEGGAEIVTVSLGAAGALVVSDRIRQRIRAPAAPIKSRVGAGDSMVAGLTLALSQGRSVAEAVKYGIAAGSAAVMTPGTQLCRRRDVERLFAQLI